MTECAGTSLKRKRPDYRQPHNCIDCGKERLVIYKKGRPESLRCHNCAAKILHKNGVIKKYFRYGKDNSHWKGGRSLAKNGYVYVSISPTSPYIAMAGKRRRVLEHRLVMAQHLGHCLPRAEIVHHKGTKYPIDSIENKSDNRIENLELVSHLQNLAYEKMCHNCELRKEIRLLRWQLKELSRQLQGRLPE